MQENKGLSGSTLKMIAIVTMFIDHIGAVIVERMLLTGNTGVYTYEQIYILDRVLRSIGRLGFPLFCFLLVEGFQHTKHVGKYACRLLVFALISEIPFNLAFSGSVFFSTYQNVFFTLLIGLITMWGCKQVEDRVSLHAGLQMLLKIPVILLGYFVAEYILFEKYKKELYEIDNYSYRELASAILYLHNLNAKN